MTNNIEEFIELLDEQGNKTGKRHVRTKGNPTPEGTCFAVVEVWVKLANNKLLLLQRHPSKDFGLQWECPGGTVRFGETYIQAVKRELYEETGIVASENSFTYLGVAKRNNWFCYSYLLRLDCVDVDITLQTEECAAYKLVDLDKVDAICDDLTEGHRQTFKKYFN